MATSPSQARLRSSFLLRPSTPPQSLTSRSQTRHTSHPTQPHHPCQLRQSAVARATTSQTPQLHQLVVAATARAMTLQLRLLVAVEAARATIPQLRQSRHPSPTVQATRGRSLVQLQAAVTSTSQQALMARSHRNSLVVRRPTPPSVVVSSLLRLVSLQACFCKYITQQSV